MYEIFEQLLRNKGITAYRLSQEIGVSQSTLSDWKRGRSTPKQDKLQKIADYFGVTVDYLMTGKERTVPDDGYAEILNTHDRHDIANDMENIREKLLNKEEGPASYDGQNLSDESIELLLTQIESMLKTIKVINKEKYNPYKNKKKSGNA